MNHAHHEEAAKHHEEAAKHHKAAMNIIKLVTMKK